MAVEVNWPNQIISVYQADLLHVTGTLYELDTDWLRLELKALEDDEGMIWPDTHRHNTEVTVAGVTYARVIEIINGYTIEFLPDDQWSVRLVGSNNNFFDIESGILTQNQVQVIPTNSAGLQTVTSGSGVLPADITAIADAVWDEEVAGHLTPGTFGERVAQKLLTVSKFLGLK